MTSTWSFSLALSRMKSNNVRIPRPPPSIYKDLADHSIFPAQASFQVPSVAHNHYSYTTLDPGHDEIRLLCRGQPALIGGQINYTLRHVSLAQNPEYEALSYTWADVNGSNDKEKQIFIDGHVVKVGSNLAAALSQLFSGDGDRILWIDALCINQIDVTERNIQVTKMSMIYSKATSVVSWLGPEYSNSEGAFRILQSFKDKGVGETLYQSEGPWNFDVTPPDVVIQDIHAIVRLFRRGYWTRSWIVQEVSFAKKITFYCETERMSWDELKSACDILLKGSPELMRALTGSTVGHVFYDLFSSGPNMVDTGINTPTGTINEVITRHRAKLVFDPRDRVYSVRSLMAPEKQALIPINYELDPETLFKYVATLIVEEEKDLSILAENKTFVDQASSVVTGEKVSSKLPSWVPEWLITSLQDKIRVDRVAFGGGETAASGVGSSAQCTIEGDVLRLKAVNIGKITQVGSLMHGHDDGEINFSIMFDVLYDWWLICHTLVNKKMFGANGFMDVLNFGQHGKQIATYPELCAEHERKLAHYISILVALYKPKDNTYCPKLDVPLATISEDERHKAELYAWLVIQWCGKRRLIIYGDSQIGVGPQCVEVGDIIVVAPGCKAPVVLRESPKGDGKYINVGDSYIEGMMEGKAVSDVEVGTRKFETFNIV